MKKDDVSQQQIDDILKALDEALEQGPWEQSNFLRAIGKNLANIREGLAQHLINKHPQSKTTSHLANRIALRHGQQEIYISLYTADGTKIQSWERIIHNLPRQTISRPIYADEEDVKALLKSKDNQNNEAYVAVYVNQSDILPLSEDKTPVDKLGTKLLTLKGKSIDHDSISRFVHASGVYEYAGGRLIKK